MNLASIVILAVVLIAAGCAIRRALKKGSGCTGCSGNCSCGCSHKKIIVLGSVLTSVCAFANPAEPPELEEEDIFPVSASFSLAFDSKYLSYGFVDNIDPILTPSAEISFFETLSFGALAIFDTTTYGRKAGYGNHAGKYTEVHSWVGLSHSFSSDDYTWLPTTIDLGLSYLYEFHPSSKMKHGDRDSAAAEDSQFITLEIGLPDLPLEPVVMIERDFMRDDGTYVALDIGHTFELSDTLSLRPSILQGYGNGQRIKAYTDVNKAGLMDTVLKVDLTWAITDTIELAGYVGWSDFIFDRRIRHAAREYEASGKWDESWNVICGLSLAVSF